MSKQYWEIHVFHAVLETWMIEAGKNPAEELGLDFSELINFIFGLCRIRIYFRHCTEKDQDSCYRTLEKAKDKNISLTERNYQDLKILHHDLNYFSMSQLLRKIFKEFFDLVKELGLHKAIAHLPKEAIKSKKKGFRRGRGFQMPISSMHLRIKKGIISIYDEAFKLKRLKIKLPDD